MIAHFAATLGGHSRGAAHRRPPTTSPAAAALVRGDGEDGHAPRPKTRQRGAQALWRHFHAVPGTSLALMPRLRQPRPAPPRRAHFERPVAAFLADRLRRAWLLDGEPPARDSAIAAACRAEWRPRWRVPVPLR